MNLINLTPHQVDIVLEDETIIHIPASGTIARCKEYPEQISAALYDGAIIPLYTTHYGDITGLPDPEEGTLYIVSLLVAQAARERLDLVSPAMTIRDEKGAIIGCRGLSYPNSGE